RRGGGRRGVSGDVHRRVRESGRRGVPLERQLQLPVQFLLLQRGPLVLTIAARGRRERQRQENGEGGPTSFPGHGVPPRGIPRLNGTAFLGKFDAYACPSGTPHVPLGATCMPCRGLQAPTRTRTTGLTHAVAGAGRAGI